MPKSFEPPGAVGLRAGDVFMAACSAAAGAVLALLALLAVLSVAYWTLPRSSDLSLLPGASVLGFLTGAIAAVPVRTMFKPATERRWVIAWGIFGALLVPCILVWMAGQVAGALAYMNADLPTWSDLRAFMQAKPGGWDRGKAAVSPNPMQKIQKIQ